ncbi:MAG: methionyl-tRNA formyltransferase [Desulfotignum sp.]|nr:methionyl-tRNA formyltransferase [Desulfotignum sp.]MCF8087721.1 methionyl-tRNA formyltransferase [Desulfotignum sp.]MCF8139251.1 methionyl-tRNA formyltransferase [Desulfotignum sp.]
MIRIVFMGTPDFAVPPLKALAARPDFEICRVITQPDRPKGRGRKPSPPPVKKAAMDMGLAVSQPEKLNTDAMVEELTALAPDYYVVAAYGQILSQRILDIPKKFPINIHASLLPQYRGAAPIQAAIRNRDDTSGVTTMVMAKALDAGDILLVKETPIHPEDTAQNLHDRLAELGAELILDTIDQINAGRLTPTPQDPEKATYAPMLKKEEGRIDWTLSYLDVVAHIRAMNPWPGAYTQLSDRRIKLFTARAGSDTATDPPGTVCAINDAGIHVAAGKGTVIIEELMGKSGKRLTAEQFLRGHSLALSDRFE